MRHATITGTGYWRPCQPADPLLWAFLGLTWCVVQMLLPLQRISIAGTLPSSAIVLMLLAIACLARGIPGPDKSVAILLESIAVLFCMPVIYGPVSYIVTRSPFAAADPWLRGIDLSLGMNASHWRQLVDQSSTLQWVHLVAYDSLIPQACVALIVLPRIRDGQGSIEFLRASVLAITLAGLLAYCIPAEGTLPRVESWAADWEALHGSRQPFLTTAGHVDGIISFPSFHAVMAVILAWSMRGLGLLSWIFAALDACMFLSTPAMGCHYLCDLAAGAGLAVGCLVMVRRLARIEVRARAESGGCPISC